MEEKSSIRKRLLSQRDHLSEDQTRQWSRAIEARFYGLPGLGQVKRVGLYWPFRNEVDTGGIFTELKRRGKMMAFPRVTGEALEFIEAEYWDELVVGRWGIREPVGRDVVPVEKIDLVIVPGVAFDEERYRIGFGKGIYDRSLNTFKGITVGLAYELQVISSFKHEPTDLRCRYVITENRLMV